MSGVGQIGQVSVVGAGPAGLMAAEVLADGGAAVTLFDRMPTAGRKLLMAGRGGLNLTHSEPIAGFLSRYGGAEPYLEAALARHSPEALRDWAHGLGEPTFVGTSGRVFPRSFKASPLLRAWLKRLGARGVTFRPSHRWSGWTEDGALRFDAPAGRVTVAADTVVLALGGASWPNLGSDGRWVDLLRAFGIAVAALKPSNCGICVAWSDHFRHRFEGHPLKGVEFRVGGARSRGEGIVTRAGLQGGGIYAVSATLRDALDRSGSAVLDIALRPDLDRAEIERRLAQPASKQSLSTLLAKRLKLSPVAIGLLHEAAIRDSAPLTSLGPARLAERINAVPVRLDGVMPLDRAISTAGGVSFDELDADLMLKLRPGTFLAGEMLDWEAPTGGYLLQAAFSTGALAGAGALTYLRRAPGDAQMTKSPAGAPEPAPTLTSTGTIQFAT